MDCAGNIAMTIIPQAQNPRYGHFNREEQGKSTVIPICGRHRLQHSDNNSSDL